MKILIVDDEYYIVKMIADTLPWGELGIEQVYKAYSASQARRIMEKETVDLLLTDIEMPQEDGLSLIRWARENVNENLMSLVLTGHQRFDYAQAAVNLHIFSYSLKPVDADELTETIRKAVALIRRLRGEEAAPEISAEDKEADKVDLSDPVEKIRRFVQEHMSDPGLNREMIAAFVHMNEDYMSHIFSTRTGGSLSNYVQEVRIEEAKKLLDSTTLSLSEISEKVGFSSTSYFHRQFKKSCGMTPQQYRENVR